MEPPITVSSLGATELGSNALDNRDSRRTQNTASSSSAAEISKR